MSRGVLALDLLIALAFAAIVVIVSPGWAVVAIFGVLLLVIAALSGPIARVMSGLARRHPKS